MPKPYPREFRDDVVRVARQREDGVTIRQVAADFGISETCLQNWLRQADVEDGAKPGVTRAEADEDGAARPTLTCGDDDRLAALEVRVARLEEALSALRGPR